MLNERRSANKNLVRRMNMALILNSLRTAQAATRAALAASTGLTRATVSSLIDELMSQNLVRETGLQPSQGGRPGTSLELNPVGGCAIGVEIGVGFVAVALTDFVAAILWRAQATFVNNGPDGALAVAERLIEQAIQESRIRSLRLLGIGVGLPGLVKVDEGLLKFAPNLTWFDIPFQAMWTARFSVPVHVVNDASGAALAEHYFGTAANYQDFIFLDMTNVGIGAGIMLDGKLFQGVDGYAGEVGHMVLDPEGPACACGRKGCWERMAGAQALVRSAIEGADPRASRIVALAGGKPGDVTAAMVAQAAQEGDAQAMQAVIRAVRLISIGTVNLINLFNPQLVVLGGALSRAMSPFLTMLEGEIMRQTLRPLAETVTLKASTLGEDARLLGAVASVLDVIFTDPAQHLEPAAR